jgi:hypothetical protein
MGDKARLEALWLQILFGLLLLGAVNVVYFRIYHEVMWILYDVVLFCVVRVLVRVAQNHVYQKRGFERPYGRIREFLI